MGTELKVQRAGPRPTRSAERVNDKVDLFCRWKRARNGGPAPGSVWHARNARGKRGKKQGDHAFAFTGIQTGPGHPGPEKLLGYNLCRSKKRAAVALSETFVAGRSMDSHGC